VAEFDQVARQRLEEALWADPKLGVVAVLDGAINPDLLDRLLAAPGLRFESLMGDYLEPDLAEVAPYAVELARGSAFTDWLLSNMWGRHWGILARGPEDFATVARRFRGLFIVRGPEQEPLYFRFYDPRALRMVAPVCTPEQIAGIFGGTREIWLEGTQPGTVSILTAADGALQSRDLVMQSL
jgi:hypothetical protein